MFPVRNMAQYGIIRDAAAYDLPINALSAGNNIRFDSGSIQRAPVFRRVSLPGTTQNPVYATVLRPQSSSDFDTLFYFDKDGSMYSYKVGVGETVVTPGAFTPASSNEPWSSTVLGGLLYVNRPTHIPHYKKSTETRFLPLPYWDVSWRAGVFRSFKDFLIAFNIQKGADTYPSMVKWSDKALFGAPPASWDHTLTTTLAGENPLSEMNSGIVDALALGNIMVIYGETQVWLMEFSGSRTVFNFRKKFEDDAGILNTNCVVEVNGKHYVFGPTDIYVHDGVTKASIAYGRVRDFIYRNMNKKLADRCFVVNNYPLGEIMFCYVSGDSDVCFPGTDRCNKAAVYNYNNNTWTFMDLPNVSAGAFMNLDTVTTYTSATYQYDLVGGTYYDQEDSFERTLVMVSSQDTANGLSTSKVLAVDLADFGTAIAFERDVETDCPAYGERTGIDMDRVGEQVRAFKVVKGLYPQVEAPAGKNVELAFAASLVSGTTPTFGPPKTFDPATQYRIDLLGGGRYLALKFIIPTPNDFKISGFDIDHVVIGHA